MNIGLFTDTYFPQINGVGTSTFTLARELRSLGHNVYIFTTSDPKNKNTEEEDVIRMPSMPFVFIHQYRVGLLFSPMELKKIAKLHLDIIHTQTEFSLGMFGKTLSKAFGIPIIHTYHTMYEDYVHYIVNGILITPNMAHTFSKFFCNFALHVVAPTQKVKNSLIEYGVTKPISVIPTGISIEKYRKSNYNADETFALRETFGLTKENKVILVLGRLAKEKSIEVVINAMPKVFENNNMARLLIVGDGPYRETLETLARDLNLGEKVIFAGSKPWEEIGRYYQLGDVFVSASISETQGLTFIEAMAAGLPVVAKKDDCLKGVIDDGKTGFVFESDDLLAEKLLYVMNDEKACEHLSYHGQLFSESLSSETFGNSIENLYHEVVAAYKETPMHMRYPRISTRSITRLAEYEYLKMKRVNRKFKKMALMPAKAVINYARKNNNGGNEK